ncbi:MerR family transcriptional regulator [Streptomyces thermolilacinus]|uniref:MerR family transcriptional regulator n=1 Tax=Streptomyces thermolilacinus TaxID=285540 RepID=UPI0033E4A970
MSTWLTAAEAAAHATRARRLLSAGAAEVTVRTIRSWVARGHLAPAGLDADGRQLFQLGDVARAELATRARALRLVGIPEAAQIPRTADAAPLRRAG